MDNDRDRPRATHSLERPRDGFRHQNDGYRNPVAQNFAASGREHHLGASRASFKGLDASGTLTHSNTQGHFHGNHMQGYQGKTFESNTLGESNNQASTNTLTNSMLPPRSGSTSRNPVIVDILKQELLSCKRQLKDQ